MSGWAGKTLSDRSFVPSICEPLKIGRTTLIERLDAGTQADSFMKRLRILLLLLCCTPVALGTRESQPRHLLASVRRHAKGHGTLAACTGKKIYVLDLNEFAEASSTPVCKFAKVCSAAVMIVLPRSDSLSNLSITDTDISIQ